jgi:hypothetical protein
MLYLPCRQIVLEDYYLHREWKVTSMKSYKKVYKYDCCPNDTYSTVSFQVVLQRHPGSYFSTVVMPAVGEYYGSRGFGI